MRTFKVATASAVTVGLMTVGLVAWTVPVGASEPPPVILHNPRPLVYLVPGASFTFKVSAQDAATVLWVVKAPGSSSQTLYSGDNTMTKRGVLKSSYTFGPFNASESGWEVGAVFVNDPTGVPSGIQESSTTPGFVRLKKSGKQ